MNQSIVPDEIIIVVKENNIKKISYNDFILKIIYQDGVGPANARNCGVRNASGDILIFLDSDCLPSNNEWLASLLANFNSSGIDIVSGRIIVPAESTIQRFIRAMNGLGTPDYGCEDFTLRKRFMSFPATNLAIRRTTFNELKCFDENLPIAEDLDFFIRAYKKGVCIRYSSKAIVYHFHRKNLIELIKHAWNTGRGSLGFIRKYGFNTKFLKGTYASVILVLFSFFFITFIFLIYNIYKYVLLFLFIILFYFTSNTKFIKYKKRISDILTFPLLLALYSFFLGVGVLYEWFSDYIGFVH